MSILLISNGTTTVDLYSLTGLHLRRRGWSPALALENEAGDDYEDVTERIIVNATGSVITSIQNLHRLAIQARAYQRQRQVVEPVWIEARNSRESNSRFALVKSINLPELSDRFYGPTNQSLPLTIYITREGAWRAVAPNTAPGSYASLISGTVQNSWAFPNSNRLTIPASSAIGDAHALPVIQMTFSDLAQKTIVALKTGATDAAISSFRSHFNASEFTIGTYLVADAAAPGGQKWERAVSGSGFMDNFAPLPSPVNVTFPAFAGSYMVFAVARSTANNVVTLAVGQGTNAAASAYNLNQYVKVPMSTDYLPVYLGRKVIPPSGRLPGMSSPANYYLSLRASWDGSATFGLRNLFIVPVGEGVVSLESDLAQLNATIDSVLERAWFADTSGNYVDSVPAMRGRYLRLRPGRSNQLHFFWHREDGKGGVVAADTISGNIRAAIRYLGVR